MFPFGELPVEIQTHCLKFLPYKDQILCSSISKQMYLIAKENLKINLPAINAITLSKQIPNFICCNLSHRIKMVGRSFDGYINSRGEIISIKPLKTEHQEKFVVLEYNPISSPIKWKEPKCLERYDSFRISVDWEIVPSTYKSTAPGSYHPFTSSIFKRSKLILKNSTKDPIISKSIEIACHLANTKEAKTTTTKRDLRDNIIKYDAGKWSRQIVITEIRYI